MTLFAGLLMRLGSILVLLAMPLAGPAGAQTISANSGPGLLRISSAVAGSQPLSVGNASATYTVSTPQQNRTYAVTAQLNAAMPSGVTLTATFAAPPLATSLGPVALDLTARTMVSGIRKNTNSTQSITYQLAATAAAGVVPTSSRTVTLTIIQAP